MKEYHPHLLVDGLKTPEGPRWHGGKLWFSDMFGQRVMTVDLQGKTEVVVEVPSRPSGLGFLPDGRLLVVSMFDKRLLRLDESGLTEVADLSALWCGWANDMVVDQEGRAYVGNLGFDFSKGDFQSPRDHTTVVLVEPDGSFRAVADDLALPNGMAISADGTTLVVAETLGRRLTVFRIQADGSLVDRRTFAKIDGTPDGICLDEAGGVWLGSSGHHEFLRVIEGGAVTDRISTPGRRALACMLGGEDRRTLFLLTARTTPELMRQGISEGMIETVEVSIPGVGLP